MQSEQGTVAAETDDDEEAGQAESQASTVSRDLLEGAGMCQIYVCDLRANNSIRYMSDKRSCATRIACLIGVVYFLRVLVDKVKCAYASLFHSP